MKRIPTILFLVCMAACKPQAAIRNDLSMFGYKGKVRTITLHLTYKSAAGKELLDVKQVMYFNRAGNRDSIVFHTTTGVVKSGRQTFTTLKNGDVTWTQSDSSGSYISEETTHWVNDRLSVAHGTTEDKEGTYTDSTEVNNNYRIIRTIHREYRHDSLTSYTVTRYEVDGQGKLQYITSISPDRQKDSTRTNITIEGYDAMDNPLKVAQQSDELSSEWVRSYTYYE